MTVNEILAAITESPGWVALIAVVASGLIEISPIKVNPWRYVAKSIGKAINADVLRELEEVKTTQKVTTKQLEERIKVEDERNADVHRTRILQFNLELIRDLKHTKEDFDDIMAEITTYEKYCEEHPEYPNKRAVHAISNIDRVYDERMEKMDFYMPKGGEDKHD